MNRFPRIRLRSAAWLLAASFVAASFAGARPPDQEKTEKGEFRGGGQRFDRLMQELELTPEQKTQIESMRSAQESQVTGLRTEMRKLRADLDQAFQQETLDEGRIYALVDQLAANRARMQKLHTEQRVAMHKILTAEQRKELKELRAKRGARRTELPD